MKRILLGWALAGVVLGAQQPDVKTIIQKSVAANDRDFRAAPQFNYKEKDHIGKQIKAYQVTMIDGSPYQRLIAVGGKPLSKEQAAEELKKQQQETANRTAQSPQQSKGRIASYEKDRRSDN
jgi:hypothetical protein